METIYLKVTERAGVLIVKDGRKIEATITRKPEGFMVVRAGMAFYRDTLAYALEFVRSNREDRANAFGSDRRVVIS
jgi:hypothetical protein